MGLAHRTPVAVPASQTDQILGTVDRKGQILRHLVVSIATSATSAVSIKDSAGGASIPVVPANAPIGAFTLPIEAISLAGAWHITTAAGVSVLAVGHFQ